MKKIDRRTALAWAAAAALAPGASLAAQDAYPARPIKMVVPFPAGNALDVVGRILAAALSSELGQQVVVETRTGATGHIGGEAVARAAPDGYTLLFAASSSMAVSPHLMRLNYRPLEDLVPVALVVTVVNMVVVHKDLPVRSIAELVAYAKANPGKLSYGSYGLGSNLHLAGEMLGSMAGVNIVHVPYSAAQLVPDLLAGRIQVQIANIPEVEQHIKEGTLRALAVTGPTRLSEFPDLPTVAETLPGYNVGAWGMMLAPAKTPPDIVRKLNDACVRLLGRAEVQASMARQRFVAAPRDVAQTAGFLRTESDRWARVVREAKVPMLN
ncbi:tripartite tricarboxylate transporter substrate binding protein [Variovorax sp. KK3]|uniref:Bug family tripartite tricarboxylate transporter substrate binding protein n=1 Tax=Variovorax sp. KK3 TaxID=1855728 RepID=UPI0015C2CE01|nr:tripartite tricarboxylate transporter substrate binding protein [Variovorax sp. KK3]